MHDLVWLCSILLVCASLRRVHVPQSEHVVLLIITLACAVLIHVVSFGERKYILYVKCVTRFKETGRKVNHCSIIIESHNTL